MISLVNLWSYEIVLVGIVDGSSILPTSTISILGHLVVSGYL